MKVLNLMGMNSTKYGGMEKFNIELMKQGVEVSIHYNSMPLSDDYLRLLKAYNVPLYIYDCSTISSFFYILKIILIERPNIIHFHFSGIVYHLISVFVKLFCHKIKQVHTLHGEPIKINGFRGFLAKLFYKCQDQLIAVSKGVSNGFQELFGIDYKIMVSYLGVQRAPIINENLKEDLNINQNTVVITSIGWDIIIKGYDVLLKAVAKLIEKKIDGDFVVIIIGLPKEEEEILRRMISHYNLDCVFLLVGIREDIDDFLNISDIYVQPSRTEAISLSIMEALQYGIPIVGSNVGGISEVCVNNYNGYIFESQNIEELAYKLQCLILSPDKRAQFGNKSFKLSKQYLRPNRAEQLIDIYTHLLNT